MRSMTSSRTIRSVRPTHASALTSIWAKLELGSPEASRCMHPDVNPASRGRVCGLLHCAALLGGRVPGGGLLAPSLLRRRLLRRGLPDAGLLRRRATLLDQLLTTDREQFVGPLVGHCLEAVATRQRRVCLTVGHVDTEAAVLGEHRVAAHRVVAEL